jgi:hypothetical protein
MIGIAAILAILAWFVPWAHEKCLTLPATTLVSGCAEYWFHRYQTLIAGLVALLAGLVVIHDIRCHTEASRADQAERMLTGLADAIVDIMQKYEAVFALEPDPSNDRELLQKLEAATDRSEIKSGLIDSLMGQDAAMLALYVNHCRFSATRRMSRREDQMSDNKIIWPLYAELIDSINQRKAELRNGTRVSTLYDMSLIDRTRMMHQLQGGSTTSPS